VKLVKCCTDDNNDNVYICGTRKGIGELGNNFKMLLGDLVLREQLRD
jgi:hypothetical protein